MKLSVIIPVHNGGEDLRDCLKALTTCERLPDEIIVVDDGSTDSSEDVASESGGLVLRQEKLRLGPAKARNRGAARAHGDILVFIDADVVVHQDTLRVIEHYFAAHPEIAALFGSYDDKPAHRSMVSLYKNLQHHFVHHHSKQDASSFWTGAGAIRRDVFLKLGGFNESYSRPSIEDIELGLRLKAAGYRVWLCADVQVKHLKRWNLLSLVRSDIFDRAVPWTELILSTAHLPSDLNLDFRSRLSAICVWVLLLNLAVGFWFPIAWITIVTLLGTLIALNFPLYHFFYKQNGRRFVTGGIVLHLLYFLYSSSAFGIVWAGYLFSKAYKHTGEPVRVTEIVKDSLHGRHT